MKNSSYKIQIELPHDPAIPLPEQNDISMS
jgi:hypothetical protein